MDCVFCKIADGEIPSDIIYEDQKVIVFNDLDPQAPIHFLVIPKKHIESLAKLDEEDLATLKFAIGNHNAKEIAPTENQRHLAFAKLIRDADKIDIYRVLKPFLGCEFMLALHVVMLVVGILFITNFKLKKPKNVTMGAIVAVVAMAVIAILVRHYMRYMSMM